MLSVVKNFVITFIVSAILFGLAAYFIVGYAVETIIPGNDIEESETLSASIPSSVITAPPNNENESVSTETAPPLSSEELMELKGNTFTALVIGTDYQPDTLTDYDLSEVNSSAEGFPQSERLISADAILMLHIDKEKQKVVVSSIPSNMRLMVDGVNVGINTLYDEKGVLYLCDKVTAVTGLPIDYYGVIAVQDFARLIDKVNGITFTVPVTMKYEDTAQNLVINLQKGIQILDGDKALQMLRFNSYSDNTISRPKLAMNFAKALLEKLTSPEYFTEATALYAYFNRYIETDFDEKALMENLELIFAYSKFEKVDITYPGTTKQADGVTYFEPDIASAINIYKVYK